MYKDIFLGICNEYHDQLENIHYQSFKTYTNDFPTKKLGRRKLMGECVCKFSWVPTTR